MDSWRKWLLGILFFAAAAPAAAAPVAADWRLEVRNEAGVLRAGKGWARDYDGLRVACFRGAPDEIGAQMYHLIVQPREDEMLAAFKQIQDHANQGGAVIRAFKDVYARLKFIPAFRRIVPDEYLRELRGFKMAASRGQNGSFTDLLMANASQDLGLVFSGCFAFAAWGSTTSDSGMIIGRNLDESSLSDIGRLQSLNFYIPENGLKFVTLNYPAFSGIMHGMNENGLVITMNFSKVIRSERTIDGLPFMFMLRKALQYGKTIDEVIAIIRETPRTIGLNILVADAGARRAAIVEVSAHRMKVREANELVFAANRFRTEYMSGFQSDGWLGSALRETRFERLLQDWKGRFDVQHAVAALRDKNAPGLAAGAGLMPGIHNEGTIASIVFDPTRLEVWTASSGGFMAPDSAFIGFSAGEVWQAGEPPQPIGIIPPVEETQYVMDWRAVMAASLDRDEKGIQERLTPVVKRNPDAAFPLLLLGTSYLREGRNEGFDLLERLVALPEVAEPFYLMQGHFWLGVFYDTDGQREHAVEHYRAALAVQVPDLQRDYGSVRRMCEVGVQRPLVYRRKGAGK